jgi:valyl-tRNA synthetase
MSKSKGNVLEIGKMIEKFSADALRFWAASVKPGEDVQFSEKEFIAGNKLINKIWNAFNFMMMHLRKYKPGKPKKLELIDEYFMLKINKLVEECTKALENYNYAKVKLDLENFFWHLFCDNFLEIIKHRLYQPKNKEESESAKYTAYVCFLKVLKLFAPIMPFITEAIYQDYFKQHEKVKSIHLSEWPQIEKEKKEKELEKSGDMFLEILDAVRKEKAKAQKSMKAEIELTIEPEKYKIIQDMLEDLKAVTSAKEIKKGVMKIEFLEEKK